MRGVPERVSYDALLAEEARGDEARSLATEAEYARLVWDFALGSPRAALACWRASLRVSGNGELAVHLFTRPASTLLDQLSDPERFALSALAWNELLAIDDAAAAARVPLPNARAALLGLADAGALRVRGDELEVTALWWPVVTRFLRRKHLTPN
jgi:hypothetical protein